MPKELKEKQLKYTYKFLFFPQTIGSIAYLSQDENLIPKMKYSLFLEMLGTDNNLVLQHSLQNTLCIDRIGRYVLKKPLGKRSREGTFREVVGNDKLVFNGSGVNVLTLSVGRWPCQEYPTSDDYLSIISEENLIEAKNAILEIINIIENDYIPRRLFKGPVFLFRYGLWVDWRINKKLNEKIEQIMLRFEGDKSTSGISEELGMEFNEVLKDANRFCEKVLKKEYCDEI